MLLPVSDVHITFQIFRRARNALRAQTHIKKKSLFLVDAAKSLFWERARTRICLVMYLKLENEAYRWKYAFLSSSISSLRLFLHSAPPPPPPSQLQWNLKLVFWSIRLLRSFLVFALGLSGKDGRKTLNSKAGLQTYKKLYWLFFFFCFTTKANNFSNLVVIDDVWFLAIISFVRFEKVFHFLGFNHLRESHVITFRIRMFLSSSSSPPSSALVQIMFHFPRHILYPCIWIIWDAFTCNEETTTSHKKFQQWIKYFEWKMTLGSYQIFRKKV